MDTRKHLRRLFESRWTRTFGPAFVVYLAITFGLGAVIGDWDIPWLFALIFAYFLLRIVLFAVIVFFPVWVAIVVLWAGYEILYKRRPRKGESATNVEQPADPVPP